MSQDVKAKVKQLPREPGVYMFRDIKGKVIYVGKAKDLKSRASSYFHSGISLEPKTKVMVGKIADLETIITSSELEALILETELIKRYKPKYNIIQKDDKSHLYIVIRSDTVKKGDKKVRLQKVITARKTDLRKGDVKFGPYTNSRTTRQILRTLRKIFPFRDCSASKFSRYQKRNKPCLYGHLGLCLAPCLEDVDRDQVRKEIALLKKFLKGDSKSIINDHKKKMKEASENKEYEKAANYRDTLKKFEYVRTTFKTAQQYIDNPNLLDDIAKKSLRELKKDIPILSKLPRKIECYDISNISGKEAVGALVVSLEGKIKNSNYKRFKIKVKDSPDDISMMKEMLHRRFKRDWELPDLVVLDGGKGHVAAGLEILDSFDLEIPVIGIAKRNETLIYKEGNEFKTLDLSESHEGLKLIIKLRDESHRFAQRYHHYLRLKKIKV